MERPGILDRWLRGSYGVPDSPAILSDWKQGRAAGAPPEHAEVEDPRYGNGPTPYALPKPPSCKNTITRPASCGTSMFRAKLAPRFIAPILRRLRRMAT